MSPKLVSWILLVGPLVVSASFLWPDVCDTCDCVDTEPYYINCQNRNLLDMFADDAWPNDHQTLEMAVNLDGNLLKFLPQFPALPILTLSLNRNRLSSIADRAFRNLSNLTYLYLRHNNLTSEAIHERVFEGHYDPTSYLPLRLKLLDLGYNRIHSLHQDSMDHLDFLTDLYLNDNPIPVLDHPTSMALATLRRLEFLSLARTGLKEISQYFLHSFKYLKTLDLRGNQLLTVPPDLQHTHVLTALNLDENPISVLPKHAFQGLKHLQELNVSFMPELRRVDDGAFAYLKALRILRLSYNERLTTISDRAFDGLSDTEDDWPLIELHLNSNNLSSLSSSLVPWWHRLLTINVQRNPWKCDCHLKWMATTLMDQLEDTNPRLTLDLTCDMPPEDRGKALLILGDDEEAFRCDLPNSGRGGHLSASQSGIGSSLSAILVICFIVFVVGTAGLLVAFWRRRKVQDAYSRKLASLAVTVYTILLFGCLAFGWFVWAWTGYLSPPSARGVHAHKAMVLALAVLLLLASMGVATMGYVLWHGKKRRRLESIYTRILHEPEDELFKGSDSNSPIYRAQQQVKYMRADTEEGEAGAVDL